MTKQDRRDYAVVQEAARKLGATIHWDVPLHNRGGYEGPRANTQDKIVYSIPIEESYGSSFWTTMHELGHVEHQHHGRNPFEEMLFGPSLSKVEQEAEAWTWAIDNAGRPLDKVGTMDIKFAIASYLYTADGHATIGPNLRRLARELGPDFDTELVRTIFPDMGATSDGRDIPTLACAEWVKLVGQVEADAA